MSEGTILAATGTIWICTVCGRRARSRYGVDANNRSTAVDCCWDTSCTRNAVLCHEKPDAETGEWRAVEPEAAS